MQNDNRKLYILHFTFLILIAFAVRLHHLDFQSIWWDEGHSIEMASAPVMQIPTLPGMDVHPPGYFAALHGWMALTGRSEFALRYLSLVFGVLTVALMVRFGRRMGGWGTGFAAGWLAALSPFWVQYSQEVRMYALVTFFAAASMYFLWEIVLGGQRSRWVWIGYVLVTAAALVTHYFTLFLLVVENLVWVWWVFAGRKDHPPKEKSEMSLRGSVANEAIATSALQRLRRFARNDSPKRIFAWIAAQVGVLALISPQLFIAARQISGYANPNLQPPPLAAFIAESWQAYTIGQAIDPARAVPFLWGIAVLIGMGMWLNRKHSLFTIHYSLFTVVFFLPLGIYFVVLQSRPSFEPRYMMLATPALMMLMALAFSPRKNRLPMLGLVAVLGIFGLGLHGYFTDARYFKDDSAGVANWLAAETTPADVVLVDVPHPFGYYADRIPAPTDYLFVDVHTAADVLNARARGKNRLYWITWRESDTDPRGVIPFLLQKQAGAPAGEQQLRGYRVQWWNLSDAPFSLPIDLPAAAVNFDNVLLLDGLAFGETLSAGQAGWMTAHLTLQQPTDKNYKLSVRLRADDGRVLAQSDKFILNDRHLKTADWDISDPALNQTINVFSLPLTDVDFRGQLTLEAVMYDAATGDAIAAYGVPTTNGDFVSAQMGSVVVK